MLDTIVYFAFGDSCISQANLSLVSLVNLSRDKATGFQVAIFTDKPKCFSWIAHYPRFETRLVTKERIEEMMGPRQFILRAKIETIYSALQTCESNLLYVDTDTIFLRKPEKIFNQLSKGACFLHLKEWPLRIGRLYNSNLPPNIFECTLTSGVNIQINDSTEMWNAGAIGIGANQCNHISDALELNDILYAIKPSWHVEQLALSIIFQKTKKLLGCRRYIFHYWHNKDSANRLIAKTKQALSRDKSAKNLREIQTDIRVFVFKGRLNYYIHQLRCYTRRIPGIYLIYSFTLRRFKNLL